VLRFSGADGVCLAPDLLQKDPELVASQASDSVGLAHAFPKPMRSSAQHGVSSCVPQPIVDHLEAVNVQEEDRHLAAGALATGERVIDAFRK